jgi:hypothetical protein
VLRVAEVDGESDAVIDGEAVLDGVPLVLGESELEGD